MKFEVEPQVPCGFHVHFADRRRGRHGGGHLVQGVVDHQQSVTVRIDGDFCTRVAAGPRGEGVLSVSGPGEGSVQQPGILRRVWESGQVNGTAAAELVDCEVYLLVVSCQDSGGGAGAEHVGSAFSHVQAARQIEGDEVMIAGVHGAVRAQAPPEFAVDTKDIAELVDRSASGVGGGVTDVDQTASGCDKSAHCRSDTLVGPFGFTAERSAGGTDVDQHLNTLGHAVVDVVEAEKVHL